MRYADDFVVVCRTKQQAQEALTLVKRVLEGELGLNLSPEKTKVTTFGKGYDFLGFTLSSRSRRMRAKSVLKFKTKIREINRSQTQPGRGSSREVKPGDPGNGQLLRDEVFDESLAVWPAR